MLCRVKYIVYPLVDNHPQRIAKNDKLDNNTVEIDHFASAQYL